MKKQLEFRPLLAVATGETVKLARVDAGMGLRQRLASMGVLPESPITVIRSLPHGQIIIKVRESRIVLGRGMANKLFVV